MKPEDHFSNIAKQFSNCSNDNFDRQFNTLFAETQKTVKSGFKVVLAIWIIGVVVSVAFASAIVYIIGHATGAW